MVWILWRWRHLVFKLRTFQTTLYIGSRAWVHQWNADSVRRTRHQSLFSARVLLWSRSGERHWGHIFLKAEQCKLYQSRTCQYSQWSTLWIQLNTERNDVQIFQVVGMRKSSKAQTKLYFFVPGRAREYSNCRESKNSKYPTGFK